MQGVAELDTTEWLILYFTPWMHGDQDLEKQNLGKVTH